MLKMLRDKEFLKKFLKVSLPVMIHSLILFIVSLVDNIMVGSVSNEAVEGVYAASQATYILMIASYGVLVGAGVYIQQFNGANDKEHLKQSFRYKFVVMALFLVVAITIYYIFGDDLVWFYCKSDENAQEIFRLGKSYLYIIILSYIPFCISIIYTTTVREVGMTKYALIAGCVAFGLNTLLNAILIYVFDMGVIGAAIATLIARIAELVVIFVICRIKKFDFCENLFKEFKIDKDLFKSITKKGTVFLFNELFWVMGMTLLSLAYAQRDGVLGALSVVNTIGNVFNILFQGLSIGIGVLVGSYLGRSDFESAKRYTKNVYLLGLLASLIFGIIIILFSPIIPNMFSEVEPSQKALATQMLVIYGLLLWCSCIYMCCYMTLKTGGEALVTFFIDSGIMWAICVPLAWILVTKTSLSLLYIYPIIIGIDLIKFFIGICFVKRGKWMKNLTLQTD